MKKLLLSVATLAMIMTSCTKDSDTVDQNALNDLKEDVTSTVEKRSCVSDEVLEKALAENPELQKTRAQVELQTQEFLKSKALGQKANLPVVTIPVYVHVLYRTNRENISEAQINSQINVLNRDFRATNSDVSLAPSLFSNRVADTQIQFELVGIDRRSTNRRSWSSFSEDMKSRSRGGLDAVNPRTTLNIWICNIQGGTLGYAYLPGGAPSAGRDGVVVGPNYFGTTGYVSAPFNLGRTTTHEIGHFLGLDHIWGGGCGSDDGIADTPDSERSNFGCPSFPSRSCGSTDMTMNYMDYVNDSCMYMFTEGQKDVMRSVLEPGGFRYDLVR